jgi:drug/metabolite transporter (DMT)-like permease
MIYSIIMTGILLALLSATSWGAGDFLGGLAARKIRPFQVLFLTTCSSLTFMLVLAILWGETYPGASDILIALLAGVSGALGLTALYKGLSLGNAALVSSVAGVVGAVIPTLVGVFIEGLPSVLHLIGYTLALAGIWLVTQSDENDGQKLKQSFGLALLAGFGFGGFLAIIAQMQDDQVFAPLVIAKIASLTVALILLRSRSLPIPKLNAAPIAIWSGFLDAGGNFLYLFATQFTRLDIAAVLSSLYPAGTVLLSGVFLKERLSKAQWLGVLVCLCAIGLVTWG